MKKVLVFSGSNSAKSINTQVAAYAGIHLQKYPASIIDLRSFEAPIYSIDIEKNQGIPANIDMLHTLFNDVAGFIIACPEHNGAIPAFFKNTIDWLSRIEKRIFKEKPVFLLTASPGARGALTVNESLQILLPRWGANLIESITIPNYENVSGAAEYFQKNEEKFSEFAQKIMKFEKSLH